MKARVLAIRFALSAIIPAGVYADSITHGSTTINMDFVNVGYAGNTGETQTYPVGGTKTLGAVDYGYRIGKLEVTIDQFSRARGADTRISDGNEGYWNSGGQSVGTGGPASYVTSYEAMKFANWLTTGNAHSGAYQFNGSGALTAIDRDAAVSAYGTVYVLPSENEWYKAAYYRPANDGSYSLYANGSDNVANLTHGTSSGWNYANSSYDTVYPPPNYTWQTGFGGEEQNGTFDMMGNVMEWIEDATDGSSANLTDDRIVRGGAYYWFEYDLSSIGRTAGSGLASGINEEVGFRVAAIPEPSSIMLMGVTVGIGVFMRRRLRR